MRLRSLMFGWEFPPVHSGGLGVACEGLVRGLQRNDVDVTLVLPHVSAKGAAHSDVISAAAATASGVVPVASLLRPYDDSFAFAARAGSTPGGHLYGPDLAAAVAHYTVASVEASKEREADVIHSHDWMTYGAGAAAAQMRDAPLVAHIHATELDRTDGHPDPWIFGLEREGFIAADRIIAVSDYTKRLLTREYGIDPGKISVVHNGHDADPKPAEPATISRHPLVLFLGRLTVQKNPHQFVAVAKEIHAHQPDVQFVMAGAGPMQGELMQAACEAGLSRNMVFAGQVSKREADALYAAASCFVMPSLSEPFGLVALEAIAQGTPVVVSRQSGVSEVLDHAFKVDFWDTAMMADCILTILREKPLATQLKTEAPRLLQRLSWHNQARAVQAVYHSLLHPNHA
ncbi:MAG: glycosyltransferase family 4 protein [Candidatus Peribacteraceae bacterium]|nr:glycosyltransferase family 4 protein [Candidatus Peribacteraceae bacterium]